MAYLPQDSTASNKPYAVDGKPDGARTYFYDKGASFRYRQYISVEQCLEYLATEDNRRGHFGIIINTGGTIDANGYIVGGVNDEYWFKDGYEDENLVLKSANIPFEVIPFTDADGVIEIDMTNRQRFFIPKTNAYNVTGDNEDLINGYAQRLVRVNDVIESITLDGIFGNGYILLTN